VGILLYRERGRGRVRPHAIIFLSRKKNIYKEERSQKKAAPVIGTTFNTILTAEPRIDFYFFNSTAKTNSATSPMRPLDPPIVETMLVTLPITSAPNRAPLPNNISANIEIETTPSPISVIAVRPLFMFDINSFMTNI